MRLFPTPTSSALHDAAFGRDADSAIQNEVPSFPRLVAALCPSKPLPLVLGRGNESRFTSTHDKRTCPHRKQKARHAESWTELAKLRRLPGQHGKPLRIYSWRPELDKHVRSSSKHFRECEPSELSRIFAFRPTCMHDALRHTHCTRPAEFCST